MHNNILGALTLMARSNLDGDQNIACKSWSFALALCFQKNG